MGIDNYDPEAIEEAIDVFKRTLPVRALQDILAGCGSSAESIAEAGITEATVARLLKESGCDIHGLVEGAVKVALDAPVEHYGDPVDDADLLLIQRSNPLFFPVREVIVHRLQMERQRTAADPVAAEETCGG